MYSDNNTSNGVIFCEKYYSGTLKFGAIPYSVAEIQQLGSRAQGDMGCIEGQGVTTYWVK